MNPRPLLFISRLVNLIRRQLRDLLVLNLLWQDQIQHQVDKRHERKARLHDQDDGIVEAQQRAVRPVVRKDVGEPGRHHGGAEAEREARGEDEAIATGEGHGRDDADTGDGDGGEQERGHAAEDGGGDSDEGCGEFGEDAHDDEPEAAGVASFTIGAAGECDDAVVLGEGGHGRDGAERGDDAVETVGEDASLDPGVEELAVDFEARDVAGRGDVADGFHGEHHVHGEKG